MSQDYRDSEGHLIMTTDEKELAEIADQVIKLMFDHNLRRFEAQRTVEILYEALDKQFIAATSQTR